MSERSLLEASSADMTPPPTVRLLDAAPDIARFLDDEQRAAAAELLVPVKTVAKGPLDPISLLQGEHAFGAIVLDGMLLSQLRVADQVALRLLGPGDVVSLSGEGRSMLVADSLCRAAARTRLALLGNEVLLAAHRWPRIVGALHARMGDQVDRIATQLAICQLPRVDQRLLALMWLLAESWGHVTSAGTTLPMSLTHDALGGLVGARRPTVTLALGELTRRGAIIHQDAGWLLLEGPPKPTARSQPIGGAELVEDSASPWTLTRSPPSDPTAAYAVLIETVKRLQEQHLQDRERIRAQLRLVRATRIRTSLTRQRIAREAIRRRQAPSG